MNNEEIMSELLNFGMVAVIFLIAIAIIFKVFCRKFQFKDKNIELYGLLLNLNTSSLISISATTINYLFLVWCTISFRGLHVIYVAVILLLVLLSEAVIDNFKGLPISIGMSVINCLAIQLVYMVYQYLTQESFSYLLLVVLLLLILFVFLYDTYYLFRNINNIVIQGKYLKNKKYHV